MSFGKLIPAFELNNLFLPQFPVLRTGILNELQNTRRDSVGLHVLLDS